ncbi:hypothetical protein CN481_15645 [Bacillus sp. AFS006103]|nr:hypothetical protein CN481_15645 [Bacillus sp. AFS006103]
MVTETIQAKILKEGRDFTRTTIENLWQVHSGEEENIQKVNSVYSLNQKLISAHHMVCIISNEELHFELQRTIQQITERGVRVYLLSDKNYDIYKSTIIEKCLIRLNHQFIGNMVLIDPISMEGRKGFISTSNLFSNQDFQPLLELSQKQLDEAYEYFIWNFWKEAELEIKTQEDTVNPREVLEPPFDLFPLVRPKFLKYNKQSTTLLTDQILDQLNDASGSICIAFDNITSIPGIQQLLLMKAEQGIDITIITRPEKRQFMFLRSIVQQGGNVFAFNALISPFILVDQKDGLFLTDSSLEKQTFGFVMDFSEVYQLNNLVEMYKKMPKMQLFPSITIGDIHSEKVLLEQEALHYQQSEYSIVQDYSEVNLGTFTAASLRDLLEDKVKPDFAHSGIIKNVSYVWEAAPKVRDKKAVKDPLYMEWHKEIERYKEYLNKIKQVANYSEERKKTLSEKAEKSFQMLKRFFLGKSMLSKEIIRNVDEQLALLSTKNIYQIDECEHLVIKANDWSRQIEISKEEVDNEIEKSEQEVEWLTRKENINAVIQEFSEKIKEFDHAIQSIQNESETARVERNNELEEVNNQITEVRLHIDQLTDGHHDLIESIQTKETFAKIFKHIDKGLLEIKAKKKHKEIKKVYDKIVREITTIMEEVGKQDLLNTIMGKLEVKEEGKALSFIKKEFAKHPFFTSINENAPDNTEILEEFNTFNRELFHLEEKKREVEKRLSILDSSFIEKENKLNRQKDDLLNQINRKQEELNKLGTIFTFKPADKNKGDDSLKAMFKKNNGSGKGSSITKDTLEAYQGRWPKQVLPAVGTLYTVDNQVKQLAIAFWKELESAEKESFRLGAELVVERMDS